jgi:hypothetical protein
MLYVIFRPVVSNLEYLLVGTFRVYIHLMII